MRTQKASLKGNAHTIIGYNKENIPVYFDYICNGIYDYTNDDGYHNLGTWIEEAAKLHNK